MIFGASSSHPVGETGGEENHTLTIEETPVHTHTRGTMEIEGVLSGTRTHARSDDNLSSWISGALYTAKTTANAMALTSVDSGGVAGDGVFLQASRNWTGETSSAGAGESHNNMPPYECFFIWERLT